MTLKGVLICGQARSGKNAVADIITEEYGLTQFAFGEAVKHFAHEVFPWIPRDPKPRDLYQDFGEAMCAIDPDVWVRQLFEEEIAVQANARANAAESPLIPLITDGRKTIEADYCRAKGYVIIRVEADDRTRKDRMRDEGDDYSYEALTHVSETQVGAIEADFTIDNGAGVSKAALRAQVVAIMEELITPAEREHTARVR